MGERADEELPVPEQHLLAARRRGACLGTSRAERAFRPVPGTSQPGGKRAVASRTAPAHDGRARSRAGVGYRDRQQHVVVHGAGERQALVPLEGLQGAPGEAREIVREGRALPIRPRFRGAREPARRSRCARACLERADAEFIWSSHAQAHTPGATPRRSASRSSAIARRAPRGRTSTSVAATQRSAHHRQSKAPVNSPTSSKRIIDCGHTSRRRRPRPMQRAAAEGWAGEARPQVATLPASAAAATAALARARPVRRPAAEGLRPRRHRAR